MPDVRVLVAPDAFGTSLTAREAAGVLRDAWLEAAPGDEVVLRPLSDGGPGFVETLHPVLGGELLAASVTGPLGEPAPAAVLLADEGRTAYVESAQALGLHLVPPDRRDPTRTTSVGVGELVAAALGAGAHRVVVGLGGSSTNDAGAGMLAGLLAALRPGTHADALTRGGGPLGAVAADDLAFLGELRDALAGVELVAAYDVDVPLLGLRGASAGFAPQKGATPEQAQELERALADFSRTAAEALGDRLRPDLLTGSAAGRGGAGAVQRLTSAPGAGAAGGLGFGLSLLGARLTPGVRLVADAVGLDARLAEADVVVTGEGRFDWQSLHGKVASEVATRALAHGVPTVLLAGEVSVGRRELAAAGITASYAVAETPEEVAAALRDPAGSLRARARRVALTWSR